MYGLLLRTFLRERLSIHRLFGQKIARSKIKSILMIGLLIYAFGVTMSSSTFISYELGLVLVQANQLTQFLFNIFSQLSSLGFLFGFFQAQGYLFQYKDFDLLGPLPIHQKFVVAAKITLMLVFVYLFAIILVLPTYGVWWYFANPSILQFFLFLPMILVTPIPLMLLGAFASYGIRKLTQRWIHANVLQTIFSVMFIITFASFSYFSNEIIPASWLASFQTYDVLGQWFVSSITTYNIFAFVGFMAIHLGILILFIHMMSQPLLTMNQRRTIAAATENRFVPTKLKSITQHILEKEWRRFIGTSIYFINTGFGLIMLLGVILAVIIFPNLITTLEPILVAMNIHPIWLIFGVVGFTLSTVYTPAVSLSLEGKNIALIKTLPIQPWVLFKAKIFFNLWLTLPAVFLTMIVAFTLFPFSIIEGVLGLAILVVFAGLLSVFFLYLNLWFPRFDYHHEVEVVKQSLAALLAVFGGFAWMGVILWLVLDPLFAFDATIQMLFVLTLETVAVSFALIYLRYNATRYYQNLSI